MRCVSTDPGNFQPLLLKIYQPGYTEDAVRMGLAQTQKVITGYPLSLVGLQNSPSAYMLHTLQRQGYGGAGGSSFRIHVEVLRRQSRRVIGGFKLGSALCCLVYLVSETANVFVHSLGADALLLLGLLLTP